MNRTSGPSSGSRTRAWGSNPTRSSSTARTRKRSSRGHRRGPTREPASSSGGSRTRSPTPLCGTCQSKENDVITPKQIDEKIAAEKIAEQMRAAEEQTDRELEAGRRAGRERVTVVYAPRVHRTVLDAIRSKYV